MENLNESLSRSLTSVVERVTLHVPQLLEAIVLLLLGWLIAKLLRAATRRGAGLVDSVITRMTGRTAWRADRSAAVLGTVVYWIVMLFFVTAATHALNLQTFSDWLARLLDHLPTVAAGLLIVVAGYLLSGFVAELVRATATALAPPQRDALARAARGATLIVAMLVGADQIGLKVTWVAVFAAVFLASVMGGVMIAVSLGARTYVANLIGAHYLGQTLQIGQRVRVADQEGQIVEMTPTSLVLETADGRVMLPGRIYHEQAIVVIVGNNGT